MPDPISGLVAGGAAIGGSILGSEAQKDAASTAARAQTRAAQMSIDEQRRQFEAIQALLAPYTQAGTDALAQQRIIMGLEGSQAQQDVMRGLAASPEFTGLVAQGENALLQNASATGGLRGGNTQAALAQFRPQMLNQLLQQRYANLGGLTSLGQSSAAMTGNAGMQTGQGIAQQYGNIGAAQAGKAMAIGQANAQLYNLPMQLLGSYIGGGGGF